MFRNCINLRLGLWHWSINLSPTLWSWKFSQIFVLSLSPGPVCDKSGNSWSNLHNVKSQHWLIWHSIFVIVVGYGYKNVFNHLCFFLCSTVGIVCENKSTSCHKESSLLSFSSCCKTAVSVQHTGQVWVLLTSFDRATFTALVVYSQSSFWTNLRMLTPHSLTVWI